MIPIGSPWDPFIELEDCIVFQVQDFSSPDQCVAEGCSGQTLRHPQLFAQVYMRSVFPVHIMFVSQVCVRSLFLSCAFVSHIESADSCFCRSQVFSFCPSFFLSYGAKAAFKMAWALSMGTLLGRWL